MPAITIETPVGPFTVVARRDEVLAAGFTADTGELLSLVHPELRAELEAGADGPRVRPGADADKPRARPGADADKPRARPGADADKPRVRPGADADLDLIAKAVRAYFDGDLTAIDTVGVHQRTDGRFQAHAWDVLRTVPAGDPISYRGYAERAGRPAAVRAAAQACARNAVALFVPCHRVVRTDGGLGGYRWGIHVKRWLLTHEGRVPETRF